MIEFNTSDDALAYLGIPTIVKGSEKSESIDLSGGNFLLAFYVSLKAVTTPSKGICYQQTAGVNTFYCITDKTLTTGSITFGLNGLEVSIFDDLDDIPAGDTTYTRRSFTLCCIIVRVTTTAGVTTIEISGRKLGDNWVDDSIVDTKPTIPAPGATTVTGFGTAPVLAASQVTPNQYPDKPAAMAVHPFRISNYSSAANVPTIANCKTNFWPYMENIIDHPTAWGTYVDTWLITSGCITGLDINFGTPIDEWMYNGINKPLTVTSFSAFWEGPGFVGGSKHAASTGLLKQVISGSAADNFNNLYVGTHVHRNPYTFYGDRISRRWGSLYPQTVTGSATGRGNSPLIKQLANGDLPSTQLWLSCNGQSWCNYGDKSWINSDLDNPAAGFTAGCDLRQGMVVTLLPRLVGIYFDRLPRGSNNSIEQAKGRIGFSTSGTYPSYDYYYCRNSKSEEGYYSILDAPTDNGTDPDATHRTWFYRFAFGSRNVLDNAYPANPPMDRWCGGGPIYVGQLSAVNNDEFAASCEVPANSRMETFINAQSAPNKKVIRTDLLLQYPGAPNDVWVQGQAVSTRNNAIPSRGGLTPENAGYTKLTGNDLMTEQGTLVRSGGTVPTFGTTDAQGWLSTDDVIYVDGMTSGAIDTAEVARFKANSIDPSNDWWALFHPKSGEGAIITEASFNAGRWTIKTGPVFLPENVTKPQGQAGFSTNIANTTVWAHGDTIKVGRVKYRAVQSEIVINPASTKFARICWLRYGTGDGSYNSPGGPLVVFPGGFHINGLSGYVVMGGGSGSLNYEREDNSLQPGTIVRIHRAIRKPDISIMMQTLHSILGPPYPEWFDVSIRRRRYTNPSIQIMAIFIPSWNTKVKSTGGHWVLEPTTLSATRSSFRAVFGTNRIPYVDLFDIYDPVVSILSGHMNDMVHYNAEGNYHMLNTLFFPRLNGLIDDNTNNFWKLELTGSGNL